MNPQRIIENIVTVGPGGPGIGERRRDGSASQREDIERSVDRHVIGCTGDDEFQEGIVHRGEDLWPQQDVPAVPGRLDLQADHVDDHREEPDPSLRVRRHRDNEIPPHEVDVEVVVRRWVEQRIDAAGAADHVVVIHPDL